MGVLGETGPEVRVQALFRDRFIAAVRAGHPLAEGLPTPERYVAHRHVVVSRRGRGNGPVDEALSALGLERTIAAVVTSFPAALAIARASNLVALVRNGRPFPPAPVCTASPSQCGPPKSRSRKCGTRAWTPTRRISGCDAGCSRSAALLKPRQTAPASA